jgi:hypothetical protein
MEFASYLGYRGIPVEGWEGEGAFFFAGRAIAEDGRCVGCRNFRCHAASRPAPGDLVIVLPDDEASSAEASACRAGGEPLFSYEPCRPLPQWLDSLVADLAGEFRVTSSGSFAHAELPDRWMDASVSTWK